MLPDLKPGVELAVLVESFQDRLGELNGYQLVDFVAAVRRQVAHLEAAGLRATQELLLCPPGFEDAPPARLDYPEDHAAGELEAACGWSRHRADNHVGLAQELGQDLTETLHALDAGELEADVAREIADGTAVLASDLLARRRVEAAVLRWIRQGAAEGMRRPRHKVRKRVEREVLRVDPEGAQKRHDKLVDDRNFSVTAAQDSTADLSVTNLPADQAAEAYAHVNALARVAKRRGDERAMPQLRADIAASLLSGTANLIACPSRQSAQPAGQQAQSDRQAASNAPEMPSGRPSGRVMLVTTLRELLGTSSGNSSLTWVGAITHHVAERIARNNLDNPHMDYEVVVTDPRSGRIIQVHQLGGLFRGRLRELVEITRPSCDWYTCDKPSIDCEIDHRTERCRQGATDLHTGGPKCRTHHRDKNKGDWQDQPIPAHRLQPGRPGYRLVGPHGHSYPIEPTHLIPFEEPPF
ncbi:DUF222 domain-containing protein [Flindersiella endophytica]